MAKHKVFISYHHRNDQDYMEALRRINDDYDVFIDESVDTDDIDEKLPDQTIRQKIRDDYLRDTTVTIVLVGTETKNRKHVDWEIYSSMIDGSINKKSGVLVVTLPTIKNSWSCHVAHGEHKYYPEFEGTWTSLKHRTDYENRYPEMPARIIDNLLEQTAKVSVMPWKKIIDNPHTLGHLIDLTFNDRSECKYNLSRPMRSSNS